MTTTTEEWQTAWQPMIDVIGQDFSGDGIQHAIEDVEKSTIRRYCEPLEFDCPLHYDADLAKQHGYRGLLAPYSGTSLTWLSGGLWKPGDPTIFPDARPNVNNLPQSRGARSEGPQPPMPTYNQMFVTDLEIEYFEPVVVGDRLKARGRKLVAVNPKETSVGRGAFTTWEREISNQRDELVAKTRSGNYFYTAFERKPKAEGSAKAEAAPLGPVMEPFPMDHVGEIKNQTVDWSKQRYWEDVNVGDGVTPVIFYISVKRLVMEAGGERDFQPMHHNTIFAQGQGARDMYANNAFVQGMWERTVREFIGLDGRVTKVGPFRMAMFNTVGESVVVSGTVKKKWQEGGSNFVELEMQSRHSKGISVGPGPVVVTLPTRK